MQETKEKWGLALEGGGARGAYQVGAYKALTERGYRFDVICGTSIGAVNGAALVQNGAKMAEDIWLSLSNSVLFGVDEETYQKILKLAPEGGLDKALDLLKSVVQKRGLSLDGMDKILRENLDEEAIRASHIDYGLVTLSLPDMTPHELFKDEIPAGKLVDYVMASANHPAFQRLSIDGKAYIDGGTYNNLPIDMLDRRGCTRVVSIRLHGIGLIKKHRADLPVMTIEPRESLGSVLDFNGEKAAYLLKLGYYDAIRTLDALKGGRFYIKNQGPKLPIFLQISPETVEAVKDLLRVNSDRRGERLLTEEILPRMFRMLDLPEEADYEDLFFALLEWGMEGSEDERFKIYSESEFLTLAREKSGLGTFAKPSPFTRRRQEAVSLLRRSVLAAYGSDTCETTTAR